MAGRIRSIKPEMLDDERTAALSDGAARLFTSAILLADDYGNLRGSERWLRAQVWWSRGEVTENDVSRYLDEAIDAGLLVKYVVNGQPYLSIKKWSKHQRIDNAGKARVPKPEEADTEPVAEIRGESPRDSEAHREIPLDLRPPTTDHRPPTPTADHPTEEPAAVVRDSAELKLGESPSGQSLQVQIVWGHYRQYHPSCPAVLKQKRKEYRLVVDRLADFSVEALRKAIDGYHRSPFHNGVNDQGAKYLDFELMMRDIGHVRKGIEMADDPNLGAGLSQTTRKTAHALGAWARGTP